MVQRGSRAAVLYSGATGGARLSKALIRASGLVRRMGFLAATALGCFRISGQRCFCSGVVVATGNINDVIGCPLWLKVGIE